jgi:integrase/recombinase XerD
MNKERNIITEVGCEMGELAEKWIQKQERSESETYYQQKKRHLEKYLERVDEDGLDATAGDVYDFLEYLNNNYSFQVVEKAYYTIRQYYDWHIRHERISENKAERIKIGNIVDRETKQEKNLRGDYYYLTKEEVGLILENVGNPKLRNKLIVKTMIGTGVRAGELVNIKLSNLELEKSRIWIKTLKDGDDRYVYFPDKLKLELRDWVENQREALCQPNEDYLFITDNGNQLHRSRVNKIVKNAAKQAGINEVLYEDAMGRKKWKITSHICRHTFAHNMLYSDDGEKMEEMDLKTLSKLLGHTTVDETAETYLHPSEEAIRSKFEQVENNLPV